MEFIPGLELCRRFHDEVVAPVLAERLPGVRYAAARLDSGSELLRFDTPRSTDHDWGPRLQIFVEPARSAALAATIGAALDAALPDEFLGHPTRFAYPGDSGLGVLSPAGDRHGVSIGDLDAWFAAALGFDPRRGVTVEDWLATPTQRLAEITGGEVFHDGLGDGPGGGLVAARARLAWYPEDVWRYVLACQWRRVAQEEHLVGRCGEVGDELGSAVLAARLARDLMRLCLLLNRRYPPYGKWLGTAFASLPVAASLAPVLAGAVAAADWREREAQLCRAYEVVGELTNAARLARPVPATVRAFHRRPFTVLDADRFAVALRSSICDPRLRALPLVGAIDQYVDSTDVLGRAERFRAAAGWLSSGGLGRPLPNER